MKKKCSKDFCSLPSESRDPLLSHHSLQMVRGKLWQRAKPGQPFPGRGAEGLEL